ncbi:MAG TPA: hypothetical protein VMG82_06700 [Candidatus Sulfotelmatobacter sp.]|nr:hypothetical protein [Candidatus Sulfotelmatobacter sp.]
MPDNNEMTKLRVYEVLVDGERWTRISSLDQAGPEDKVFVLDHDGTLVLGDGEHGKGPPEGSDVTILYRHGGGTDGNVALAVTSKWPLRRSEYLVSLSDRGCHVRRLGTIGERCSGEKRPRYFSGQLLTASDFEAEQNYFLQKSRRHNRCLHGMGIASGLEISVTGSGESSSIVISPGCAVDRTGRELVVCHPIALCLPDEPSPQFVALRYLEKETDFVPSPDLNEEVPSRIEECVLAWIATKVDTREALTIGRVAKGASGWEVDPTFQPQRAR